MPITRHVILLDLREEVPEGWRSLHNEELHNLYSSPDIIMMINLRRMRWVVHVAHIILAGKREGKNTFEGLRLIWEVSKR
jgi:hypothetical protein